MEYRVQMLMEWYDLPLQEAIKLAGLHESRSEFVDNLSAGITMGDTSIPHGDVAPIGRAPALHADG